MTLKQFRVKSKDEKISLLQKRLDELKKEGISISKNFSCDDLNFSYTSLLKELDDIGYEIKDYMIVEIPSAKEENSVYEYMLNEYAVLEEYRKKNFEQNKPKGTSLKIYSDTFQKFKDLCSHYPCIKEYVLLDIVIQEGLKHFT